VAGGMFAKFVPSTVERITVCQTATTCNYNYNNNNYYYCY